MATKKKEPWETPQVDDGVPLSEHEGLLYQERARNIRLAIELLGRNTTGFVMGFTDSAGGFYYEASSATYGLGAAERVGMELRSAIQKDIEDR